MRGVLGTAHYGGFIVGNTKISLLLNDGTDPGETLFQFPMAPVVKDSITDVYSSDGDITIYDQELFIGLSAEQEQLTGTVDYDKGILKLAAEPDEADSVYATFKTSYRNIPYHTLVKRLLTANGFRTGLVEDATFWDRYGNRIPTTWQRPVNAWKQDTQYLLSSTESFGIAAGRNSDLYIANGSCLIKWDGEKFNLLADLNPYFIFRIEYDALGDRIFGITGSRSTGVSAGVTIKRRVFCYDSGNVSYYTGEIAAYMDTYTNLAMAYDGGQWKGFSVSGGYIWFIYHVSGSDCGLARLNTDGSGLTKYNLGTLVAYDHGMDFVDTGTTIEFFYAHSLGGGSYCCAYSTLDKNTGAWTHNGNMDALIGHLPYDVTYHPGDDKIYLNILRDVSSSGGLTPNGWWGYFISVPRNSVTHNLLWEYKEDSSDFTGMQSRLCGGVYYDGYCWYVKGTGLTIGHEIDKDDSDTANGHLYKIANDVITDCGGLALRQPEEQIHYVRKDVKGISGVLCFRQSDNALFYISSDMIVRERSDYGYAIGRYSPSFMPLIRLADIDGQSVWKVLADLAIPIGYELGVTRDGEIFYRQRSGIMTYLEADINDSETLIPTTGESMSKFNDTGIIQIHKELITYTGKSENPLIVLHNYFKKDFSDSSLYDHDLSVTDAIIQAESAVFENPVGLTSDHIQYIAQSTELRLGTSNFGILVRMAFNTIKNGDNFILINGWASPGLGIMYGIKFYGPNTLYFYSSAGTFHCNWTPVPNTEYSIEFDRYGSDAYIFIDGISQVVTIDTPLGNVAASSNLDIGAGQLDLVGYSYYGFDGRLCEVVMQIGDYFHISNFDPSIQYGENFFTGCVRGCYNSVAVAHGIPAEIWKIDNVLINIDTPYYQRLKWAEKKPNWEEIYNYIIVKYGDTQLVFDYRKAGETWEGCSEQMYGRLEYTIDNQFLTDEDGVLAEAIGWRYYDLLHNRKGLIEAETRWQPQIDLGNQLSIYQTDRVYLDYVVSKVRRIELMFSDFYVRVVTLIHPSALRNTIYDYEYY
jgi:hypothetical protein